MIIREQKYRQQFEKPFDFLAFNKEFTLSQGSDRYAIAFDPSYVAKYGKKTPMFDYPQFKEHGMVLLRTLNILVLKFFLQNITFCVTLFQDETSGQQSPGCFSMR